MLMLNSLIADYCLHNPITYCPQDPQLNPKPWPPCPAKMATPTPKKRTKHDYGPLLSHIPNPKQKGSAARDRYALYRDGLTWPQLLALGLRPDDLRWDTAHAHLTWTNP